MSAFEICSGLFDKHKLQMLAKHRPSFLQLLYLLTFYLQVLLYDVRSDKPLLVKDHQYELPIKKILFHDPMDLVLSIDTKILKLWDRNTVSCLLHIIKS